MTRVRQAQWIGNPKGRSNCQSLRNLLDACAGFVRALSRPGGPSPGVILAFAFGGDHGRRFAQAWTEENRAEHQHDDHPGPSIAPPGGLGNGLAWSPQVGEG